MPERVERRMSEDGLSETKAFTQLVIEERPALAYGVIRFNFNEEGALSDAQRSKYHKDHSITEWISHDCCRRGPNGCG